MNRRNALKIAGITLATATVSVQAKEAPVAETTMNRMKMKVEDPVKPTNYELKHLPQITVKEKDTKGYTVVEVLVGQKGIIHPSTPGHWVDFIELYADDKLVGKNVLEANISSGSTLFSVKLDGVKTLTSHAGCNLHGIWTASVKV